MVVIVVDTLRADHTGLYGYDRPTTPAIDAWAERGTVFDRAWSTSSWTKPSVAMLFTGQARVENSGKIPPWQSYLPDFLRARGYRTGAVIANPLFVPVAGEAGFERAFDHYAAYDKARDGLGRNAWPASEVTRQGVAWLEERSSDPFFLYLMYFDPHDPYRPEDPTAFAPRDDPARRARFESALRAEDRASFDDGVYAGIEERRALYDAEVLQADRGIGAFLDWLDEAGLAEDTLVVLTADHGEGLWERARPLGENPKDINFYPALHFDHGIMLTSEQVHVPLVVAGPGVPAGERRGEDVSLLDVLPTVLARCEVPGGTLLHGRDLFDPECPPTREIVSVCSRGTSLTVDGRFRLHQPRQYRIDEHGAAPELFDLAADPAELRPLDDPGRIAGMQEYIALWRTRHSSDRPLPAIGDAEREALRAIGYGDEALDDASRGAGD